MEREEDVDAGFRTLLVRRGTLLLSEQLEALELLEVLRRNGVKIRLGGNEDRIGVFLAKVRSGGRTVRATSRCSGEEKG